MTKPINRCFWCLNSDIYEEYHDKEWGVPVYDDGKHFEFLLLETMQAGLSWITILKRRENYRKAFANFDYNEIAQFDEDKILKLMDDVGIIRNRKKIEAAITNAQCFIKLQKEYSSFNQFIWSFTDGKTIKNTWADRALIPGTTDLSDKISKNLKSHGFKFIGSTTIYAYLQAVGIVNDHMIDCFRYNQV